MNYQTQTLKQKISIILLSIIIMILAIIPAVNNYKYNDHSKNWLNHDYGKNLLSSTEEYSVFMTEGGDNQVFSSLYFTYAVKLRQDLFPYDQKGNIFKKIYGDLRYIIYDNLQIRSDIVNKALFTGQEPFYVDIRSQKNPYFVPYALGKPATYLTWELANQHILGNFYYKNYGLMHKAQEIRYAIIDYIETLGSANINEIKIYLKEKLGRNINDIEFNFWLDQLKQDDYISQKNNIIIFLKSYPKPFKKQPIDNFIIRWQEIKNLEYYDYLSREIVISYSYEQVNLLKNQIIELQKIRRVENSKNKQEQLDKKISTLWNQLTKYAETIKKVGYDSAGTLHNLGIFYLNVPETFDFITNDYVPIAIETWEQALNSAPYSWSTYNILLWAYVKQAIIEPQNSDFYFEKFDYYVNSMTNNMTHWKSMSKNISKNKVYKAIEQLINIRQQSSKLTGEHLIKQKEQITQMINNSQELDFQLLQSYFTTIINQLNFLDNTTAKIEFNNLWYKAWTVYQNNPEFFQWHITTLGELSGYKDLISQNLYLITAQDAEKHMPLLTKVTEVELPLFISMFKIGNTTQNTTLRIKYKIKLLEASKKALPQDQYIQIKQQIDNIN
ncbi:MAG: hypothetical protein KFW21_02190 [Spirochaetota bacterium]|nr:hypothetical protein [Spirochaetota bacterium]